MIHKLPGIFKDFVCTLLAFLLTFSLFTSTLVRAISDEDVESILQETTFYDPDFCITADATDNNAIYTIGDSILNSAMTDGNLIKELKNKKYGEIDVNAINGRSISQPGTATNSKSPSTALDAAKDDANKISSAGTVLIVLGSSPDNYGENIPPFMEQMRSTNKTARFFWVNVGTKLDGLKDSTKNTNAAIQKYSEEYNYKIINWNKEVNDKPSLVKSDGVSLSIPNGVDSYVKLITNQLGEYSGGTPGNKAPVEGTKQEKNAAIVWNNLVGKGLTAEQAAGFLGNMETESRIDPSLIEVGGTGHGLVQWSFGRWSGSYPYGLSGWASKEGKSWQDINLQLDFLWYELNHGYRQVLSHLKKAKTVATATDVILLEFEKPAEKYQTGKYRQQRIDQAKKWFNKFSKYEGGNVGNLANECIDVNTTSASSDGYVFPQKTTKNALKNTPGNSNWMTCQNPVSKMGPGRLAGSCHHDYLAADIMNKTGTVVMSTRPGIVVSAHDSGRVGFTVRIYSDKKLGGDGLWYYYAHNLSGSGKVKVGDKVKAGQEIAKVGTTEDAEGTPPHTHIDVSPVENNFGRGSYGTQGPLLNPNPNLRAAYKNLPEG